MRRRLAIIAIAAAASLAARGATLRSVDAIRAVASDNVRGRVEIKAQVQIAHRSGLRKGMYAICDVNRAGGCGILAVAPDGASFDEGDVVDVEGPITFGGATPSVKAASMRFVRHVPIDDGREMKLSDFRRGFLNARRVFSCGVIDPANIRYAPNGSETSCALVCGRSVVPCRVPGILDAKYYLGKPVKVVGCPFGVRNASGETTSVTLEVASLDDIRLVEKDWRTLALSVSVALTCVFAAVALAIWAKARREKIARLAVAAERLRMASELHDTVEQHFAAVRLLLVGALHAKGLPESAASKLKQAAATMARAKVEVRDAVTNLNGVDGGSRTIEQSICGIAEKINASGTARVRVRFGNHPDFGASVRGDLAAIVREAVTNAVKHGKAKNIAIVGDWETGNGERGTGNGERGMGNGERGTWDGGLGSGVRIRESHVARGPRQVRCGVWHAGQVRLLSLRLHGRGERFASSRELL